LFLDISCEISGLAGLNKQPWTNSSRTYVLCQSPSLELCEAGPLEPDIQWHYNFWDRQRDLVAQGVMFDRTTCDTGQGVFAQSILDVM